MGNKNAEIAASGINKTFSNKYTIPILVGIVVIGLLFGISKLFFTSKELIAFEYIPFKEVENDRWGILSMDGSIVIANEWENEPTIPSEGFTIVKNKQGLYEYYTVEKKTRKIGGEYKNAGAFVGAIAPVAKKNSHISYIDKSGKELFSLDEIEGSSVEKAGSLREGLIRFCNAKKQWGFVNGEGKLVIKPIYDAVASFKDGISQVEVFGKDAKKKGVGFINKKGDYVIALREDIVYGVQGNGLIPFSEDKGESWGFIDYNGEKVVKPKSNFKKVMQFYSNFTGYYDGENWGLIDKAGEVKIRAKYKMVIYNDGMVLAIDNDKIGYFSTNGDEIIQPQYKDATWFTNGRALVKEGSTWMVINKKGKPVNKTVFQTISSNLASIFEDAIIYSDFSTPAVSDNSNRTDNSDENSNVEKRPTAPARFVQGTAIAIVDSAYFYGTPDLDAKSLSYVVAGEEVVILKENNDFIFATFRKNGRVTDGWMLKNDFGKINYSNNERKPVSTQEKIVQGTATAIVDRAYFYGTPDLGAKSLSYILAGEEVVIIKEKSDFVYATFRKNGKGTEGWMLKSDLGKITYTGNRR